MFFRNFFILRRIQRDTMIGNLHRSSRKMPLILVRFLSSLNFRDLFWKNNEISNLMKILPVRCSMRSNRQTDRYDEANNRFSQFC